MKKFVVVGGIAVLALIGIVSMQLKVKGLKVAGEGPAGAEQKLASATADSEDAIPPSMKSNSCGKSVKPLSAPLQALLLQDEREHNYAMLLAEIKSLGKDLSATDTAALMEMLAWPNDRFPKKMRPIEINAVKNDVLDKLLRQASLPEGLSLQLVEMAGDVNQDVVWRDYCIQFMDPLYGRLSLATNGTKKTHRQYV